MPGSVRCPLYSARPHVRALRTRLFSPAGPYLGPDLRFWTLRGVEIHVVQAIFLLDIAFCRAVVVTGPIVSTAFLRARLTSLGT
jgi:hypothetical protein